MSNRPRPGKKNVRLDQQLVDRELLPDTDAAQRYIMAGRVIVRDTIARTPGETYPLDVPVSIKPAPGHVSRGGKKLEAALEKFKIPVTEKECLDVGASTGGFTDCLLQKGALHVTAIDVGYGQFDYRLRNDERVVLLEKTNFRFINPSELPRKTYDIVVVDVSFISLRKILPVAKKCMRRDKTAWIIPLVKPQFEVSREEASKNRGVIYNSSVRRQVLIDMIDFVHSIALTVEDMMLSPVKGARGNREFFLKISQNQPPEKTRDREKILLETLP